MADQKVQDRPEVPPPPPRQPDASLKGYIERGNKGRPQGREDREQGQ